MSSNSRAENQYYGKYRECCVIAHLNHAEVEYLENYDIPEKERKDIFEKSKIVSNFIGNILLLILAIIPLMNLAIFY